MKLLADIEELQIALIPISYKSIICPAFGRNFCNRQSL
jgi:hypothetical protein